MEFTQFQGLFPRVKIIALVYTMQGIFLINTVLNSMNNAFNFFPLDNAVLVFIKLIYVSVMLICTFVQQLKVPPRVT